MNKLKEEQIKIDLELSETELFLLEQMMLSYRANAINKKDADAILAKKVAKQLRSKRC